MLFPSFFNAGPATYEIEQSLRFDGSSRLNRTLSSAGNRTNYTISFWTKRSRLSGASGRLPLLSQGYFAPRWAPSGTVNKIEMGPGNQNGTGNNGFITSTEHFRDASAWYHIVIATDFDNATGYDRMKIWVNNQRLVNNWGPEPTTGDGDWNSTITDQYIGWYNDYYEGYIAELHSVDGTELSPTDFGEYDDNGVWRPKRYTGSHGTQGFYLKFDPDATNGIGHDHSGNGNNFTATGFTTSGTGTDVMSDTPTTNYPTGNPLASNNPSSVSEGNLKFVGDPANIAANGMHTTMGMSSGKWYFEVDINVGGGARTVGILPADAFAKSGKTTTTNYDTYYNDGALSFSGFSQKVEGHGSSVTINTYGDTWTTNDVIGVAFDADNGKLFFAKNNTWQESGDPAAGTNAAFTGISGTYVAHAGGAQGFTATFNFGQRAFAYTPPTGFKALNTSNLPAPTVKDGSDYFNTVLYTGDGASSNAITGVGFQPDWVWAKQRNSSRYHSLYDSVRGADLLLQSQTYSAEIDANGTGVTSFDSDGFTVGSDGGVNQSSGTYVAWNWLAGGSGSSNTNGTITSTVSASPSSGFSIASYTGTNSSATVGHGLGVELAMYIVKDRDNGNNWAVYHKDLGNTTCLFLDTTAAQATASSTYWNNTSPTSTTFSIGNNARTGAARDYVAYCFAEVEGYSKFGSYTGNNSTDGPFVYTGFRPAVVLAKSSTLASTPWWIIDSTRSPYNLADESLRPDNSVAEQTGQESIDFLSNGFKIRTTDSAANWAYDYIFMALAENPFGGDGVSPATAR